MPSSPFPRVEVVTEKATGHFGEVRVVEKTPIVELTSSFGLSDLRDIVTLAGSGTATTATGEHLLTLTANGTDAVTIDSAERGRYNPGMAAEVGLGLRMPAAPTGNQVVVWGYTEGNDGFYFGQDATGLYVARLAGGVETLVRQTSWNADKLDGTGPSGLTLDMTRGNIFQIDFAWYGYGGIEFVVMMLDGDFKQKPVVVHRLGVSGTVSLQNPNLPIRVKAANNGTATALSVYVGGRQFSVIGRNITNERITTASRLSLAAIGTTALPLLSVRRKSTAQFLSIPVRVAFVEAFTDASAILEVFLDASLTGASYGSLTNIAATETALELDTTASAVTGGILIYSTFIAASGSGGNRSGSTANTGLSISIPADVPVTVAIRAFTGTVTASALLGMTEAW